MAEEKGKPNAYPNIKYHEMFQCNFDSFNFAIVICNAAWNFYLSKSFSAVKRARMACLGACPALTYVCGKIW